MENISTGIRVKWKEKKTESGIQIANGPTHIYREGILAGIYPNIGQTPDGRQVPIMMAIVAIVDGSEKGWIEVQFGQLEVA